MTCVRVPSIGQEAMGEWWPLTRRDYQRHHVGELICTKFGRNTRSKLLSQQIHCLHDVHAPLPLLSDAETRSNSFLLCHWTSRPSD
jgi:hypothetical protein